MNEQWNWWLRVSLHNFVITVRSYIEEYNRSFQANSNCLIQLSCGKPSFNLTCFPCSEWPTSHSISTTAGIARNNQMNVSNDLLRSISLTVELLKIFVFEISNKRARANSVWMSKLESPTYDSRPEPGRETRRKEKTKPRTKDPWYIDVRRSVRASMRVMMPRCTRWRRTKKSNKKNSRGKRE